jgi:hypothetical protein
LGAEESQAEEDKDHATAGEADRDPMVDQDDAGCVEQAAQPDEVRPADPRHAGMVACALPFKDASTIKELSG